jgi:hypothetical protein
MGYNDLETSTLNLYEAGVLSSYRPVEELYVEPTYVSYNYADTEVYNRKIRSLDGGYLSLEKEINIFDNYIYTDFESAIGMVSNEKQLMKFSSDNILESIINYRDNMIESPYLSVKYEGSLVSGYLTEGIFYTVIQEYVRSGHLLTPRGYVSHDYWDDNTYENVNPNYNEELYSQSDYVELDYSDYASARNNTLAINGMYDNLDWVNNEPDFVEPTIHSAFSFSEIDDRFIHVVYNKDLPYVNTFYMGEQGPLQFYMIPSNTNQPYIDYIEILNYSRTKILNQFIMYYGGVVNSVPDPYKIHHVKYTDGDRNLISTLYYDYDSNGNITQVREEY